MRERDALHRFVFDKLALRGELVRLDNTWLTALQRRHYPPAVQQVLGEGFAAAALLYATIKFDGLLTLQVQGDGALHLLVVQCTSGGQLRGVARWDEGAVELQEANNLTALCGSGTLTMTIEPKQGERYQGIVELRQNTASVSAAVEHYFARSEQLPTVLHLVTNQHCAAGLLLQKLPEQNVDSDAWNRVQILAATVTEAELFDLPAKNLIQRLFAEETVRLFASQPLAFNCRCSRERG